jgi:hypothetical protein
MENEFGVCIRSVIYGICQKRNYFSSLSDNYFIGVQLPTYKFINYTYQRVLQKISIVKHNREIADRDKRYISEYEREDRALRLYVNKTLLIELNLLENDLDMYGANKVLYEQPQLKQVVEEIDDVRKVVKQWIN